jgi:hypothetical protein
MYWVKRKIRQIRRVIDFLPLLWNGFDFDYRYALELFKKQLERQAKFMESDKAMTLSAKTNARKIRTAIRLMDKVYDEEYGMEYMALIDKLYGTTHYDFVGKFGLSLRNEGAVDEEHQKEINEVRKQMMLLSRDKQNRAHKLLWDFIEHNIQRWWD